MDTTTNRTASNLSNNQLNLTDTLPTVLCVDDDSDQRMLLRAVLEHFGFRVMTAKSASDALEIAQWLPFEVALLDYELPDMTGAQLAHEIRAIEPLAAIILLSGCSHLRAGELIYVDAHVVKGSPISELLDTIHSLTGSPQWAQSRWPDASVSQVPPGEGSVVKRDGAARREN
ncbi:MAG: response regulator receiver protein [Acidobacteriaceae bacterium]|nr:response regulator receiver protein [Acidobacteriaceae bacterium]